MTRPIAFAVALVALSLGAAAQAQPNTQNCFRMSQLQSTRADGQQTIYARVGVSDFYRIDLAFKCTSLPYPSNGLVLIPAAGKDLICTPLDLDLKANEHGAIESCPIKSITRLTPEEAAAIPKKSKP